MFKVDHQILYRRRAERVALLIAGLPFVRMVGLNGSVARDRAEPESDIDFLIVGSSGRLFTVRLLVTILTHILGVRRHHHEIAGRICLNRYQTLAALTVEPQNQYHAEVFHDLIPLVDIDHTYQSYQRANQWMTEKFALPVTTHYRLSSRSHLITNITRQVTEWILGGWLGNWFEQLQKKYQTKKIMTNQLTDRYPERIWVSDEALLFHPPGPGEIDADLNRWDIAAPAYDQLQGKIGDPFRRSVLDPAILSAIGSLKEKKILDAGCGNGYLTNLFAAAGADTLGIDGSVVMIARARQNFPDRSYQVADLNQQLPLDDQSFDAIVCSMVLHTLPKPIITLTELARILKPTGRLIITLPHPCFAYPTGIVHWRLWDRLKHHPAHLEITNYLPERSVSIPLHGIRFPTNRYHRPLTRWWQEFAAAGLVVTSLTEPSYHSVKPRSFFSLPSLKNTPLALVLTLQKLHQKS